MNDKDDLDYFEFGVSEIREFLKSLEKKE